MIAPPFCNFIYKMSSGTCYLHFAVRNCRMHLFAIEAISAEKRDKAWMNINNFISVSAYKLFAKNGKKNLQEQLNQYSYFRAARTALSYSSFEAYAFRDTTALGMPAFSARFNA